MLDLSIIIPVFNGERFIDRCINSIYELNLPEDNFEVIVVNDYSKDKTERILEKWKILHKNFSFYSHYENKGPGGARNTGIRHSVGTYLLFVDADDTVCSGLVDALEFAKNCDAEMVLTQMCYQKGIDGEFFKREYNIPSQIEFSNIVFCENYYDIVNTGSVYNYIYKASFIKENVHFFIEKHFFEDLDWIEENLVSAHTIAYINSVSYKYYATSGSVLHSINANKEGDKLSLCYRRLVLVDKVQDQLSAFSSLIIDQCIEWINKTISLRHLTKYPPNTLSQLYLTLSPEQKEYIIQKPITAFAKFSLKHSAMSSFLVALFCFPAVIVRKIVYNCKWR